jgi:hypothetical protein
MTLTFPSIHGRSQITVKTSSIDSIILTEGATAQNAAIWAALGGNPPTVGKHWIVEGGGFRHLGKYESERDLALEWRQGLLRGQD